MSNPTAQQPTKPQGAAAYDPRKLPQCWFLAEIVEPLPVYGWAASGHVYISRSESGMYRVLRRGVAKLVSEGVAARHFRRVRNQQGEAVRVSQQQKWCEVWEEAMAESRRCSAA